ncbi:MAG: hypothetical protein JF571_01250 [Asticcacaulis sp.]|nr:hypothetical protein [Asticcacaulis sp.]
MSHEGARPGSVEFYRQRAMESLRQAEQATTEEAKASFLALAEHWQRLAQAIENPSW